MLKLVGTTPKLSFLPYQSWLVSNHDHITISSFKWYFQESKNLFLITNDNIDRIVEWEKNQRVVYWFFLPLVCLLLQCLEWNGWTWVRPANGRKTQRFVWQDTTRLLGIYILDIYRKTQRFRFRKIQRFVWQLVSDKTQPVCFGYIQKNPEI